MILVDTSVWVDHLRSGDDQLRDLLDGNQVLGHPHVLGELACGNLSNREEILRALAQLPQAPLARDHEVLLGIEEHHLVGVGIGYIDAHLLMSTLLAAPARLWTTDQRLHRQATRLGLGYEK